MLIDKKSDGFKNIEAKLANEVLVLISSLDTLSAVVNKEALLVVMGIRDTWI